MEYSPCCEANIDAFKNPHHLSMSSATSIQSIHSPIPLL